jgi:hypothetical protein
LNDDDDNNGGGGGGDRFPMFFSRFTFFPFLADE